MTGCSPATGMGGAFKYGQAYEAMERVEPLQAGKIIPSRFGKGMRGASLGAIRGSSSGNTRIF